MTNQQLYLAIGIPMLFNTVLIGLLVALINSKFAAFEAKVEGRFATIEARLDAIDKRFDDMRDLWRAELRGRRST